MPHDFPEYMSVPKKGNGSRDYSNPSFFEEKMAARDKEFCIALGEPFTYIVGHDKNVVMNNLCAVRKVEKLGVGNVTLLEAALFNVST